MQTFYITQIKHHTFTSVLATRQRRALTRLAIAYRAFA